MIDEKHKKVQKSFSKQWSYYKEGDKTWFQTIEERKNLLLKEIDEEKEWLKEKNVLDAGCGNGTVSQCFYELGANVTGVDISKSVVNNSKRFPNVKFMQADLMALPFKEESFDLVYSKGVIHHTYSSKIAFENISKLVKKNGKLYVWVYSKSKGFKKFLLKYVKPITKNMPEFLQNIFFPVIAVFRMAIEGYTYSEAMVNVYDLLACPYRFEHTESEVVSWFKGAGYEQIKLTEKVKVGFGICGVKNNK
ncbi:MAG: methyltransferase domain-containing protein [archaeon]